MEKDNLLNASAGVHEVLEQKPFGYAVVGGLVTDALLDERTVIDSDNRTVIVDNDSIVPTVRPNGTMKDIDMLAFTPCVDSVHESLGEVRHRLREHFPQTSVSLSGYETEHNDTRLQIVARTVVHDEETLCLSMGSVRQEIPAAHLEDTWRLAYRDMELSVLHPVAHLMSYRARSLAGVRPKDARKVGLLDQRLRAEIAADEYAQFIPWEAFSSSVQDTYTMRRLFERPSLHRAIMVMGRIGLGMIERSPRLIKLSQDDSTVFSRLAHTALAYSRPAQITRH